MTPRGRIATAALLLASSCAARDQSVVDSATTTPTTPPVTVTWSAVPATVPIHDGRFISRQEGWLVGEWGTILHTIRGGGAWVDWEPEPSHTLTTFEAIDATTSPTFAMAVGAKGTVARRGPQGKEWSIEHIPGELTLRRVMLYARSDGRIDAWVSGEQGDREQVYHSADARRPGFQEEAIPGSLRDAALTADGALWLLDNTKIGWAVSRRPLDSTDWTSAQLSIPPSRKVLNSGSKVPNFGPLVTSDDRRSVNILVDGMLLSTPMQSMSWTSYAVERGPPVTAASPPISPATPTVIIKGDSYVLSLADHRAVQREGQPADDTAFAISPSKYAMTVSKRLPRFHVTDAWMAGSQIWAVGSEVIRSTDGLRTWTTSKLPVSKLVRNRLLHTVDFDPTGARGWAMYTFTDLYGMLLHYDGGEWHESQGIYGATRLINTNERLITTNEGRNVWLMTFDGLAQLDSDGHMLSEMQFEGRPNDFVMCPDGKAGTVSVGDRWWSYDGTAWKETQTVRDPTYPRCEAERCALSVAQFNPSATVCVRGDTQVWSLSMGETADGKVWRPFPNLEPYSRKDFQQLRSNGAVPPTLLAFANSVIVLGTPEPQTAFETWQVSSAGSDVKLAWTFDPGPGHSVEWSLEGCFPEQSACGAGIGWGPPRGAQIVPAGTRYTVTLTEAGSHFRTGDKIAFRLTLTVDGLTRRPQVIGQVTIGEGWLDSMIRIIMPYFVMVLAWATMLGLMWILAPTLLLSVNDGLLKLIERLPSAVSNLASAVVFALLWPRLTRTRRVVTAWTRRHLTTSGLGFGSIRARELREQYESNELCLDAWVVANAPAAGRTFDALTFSSERRGLGVTPVRMRVGSSNVVYDEGLSEDALRNVLAKMLTGKRAVCWISGDGGTGKSHTALRLARWMANDASPMPHQVIVLLLDENLRGDDVLPIHVTRLLSAWTGAGDVSPSLVSRLLASGRLMLLWDGLSERDESTIALARKHLEDPGGARLTLCTTRSPFELESTIIPIFLEPLPIAADRVLTFLTTYRSSLPEDERLSDNVLETIRASAVSIAGKRTGTPLTALLLILLWRQSRVEVVDGSLDNLTSVIDVFARYLMVCVVPAGSHDAERLRNTAVVQARVLARLALGDQLRPGAWFLRSDAEAALRASGAWQDGYDVIGNFVRGGVLEAHRDAAVPTLRFVLDPLSEFLAALETLFSYRGRPDAWKSFLVELADRAGADGFRMALQTTTVVYGARVGLTWPAPGREAPHRG